jgi:hypothetical protein
VTASSSSGQPQAAAVSAGGHQTSGRHRQLATVPDAEWTLSQAAPDTGHCRSRPDGRSRIWPPPAADTTAVRTPGHGSTYRHAGSSRGCSTAMANLCRVAGSCRHRSPAEHLAQQTRGVGVTDAAERQGAPQPPRTATVRRGRHLGSTTQADILTATAASLRPAAGWGAQRTTERPQRAEKRPDEPPVCRLRPVVLLGWSAASPCPAY